MFYSTSSWLCNHGSLTKNIHQSIFWFSLHGNCISCPKARLTLINKIHPYIHLIFDLKNTENVNILEWFSSMFSLFFLHIFLYGCNIFTWKKWHINYSFILELTPTKELKYREVFLICAASMTTIIGVLFIHLSLLAKGYSSTLAHTIPGFLLLVIS